MRLQIDPTAHYCAALLGWDYPTSWAELALGELVDIWRGKDAPKWPRPFPLRGKADAVGTEKGDGRVADGEIDADQGIALLHGLRQGRRDDSA